MDEPITERASEIDEDLLALIKPEMQPGERLLWADRRRKRSPLSDRAPVLTGCLWSGGFFLVSAVFLVLGTSSAPQFRNSEGFIIIVGLISGIIGLGVLIGTASDVLSKGVQRRRLDRTVYALTDRRAIIWCPVPRSAAVRVDMFPRGSIKAENIHRIESPDGSGDLVFRPLFADEVPTGFAGIEEVRRVDDLVRRYLIEAET